MKLDEKNSQIDCQKSYSAEITFTILASFIITFSIY